MKLKNLFLIFFLCSPFITKAVCQDTRMTRDIIIDIACTLTSCCTEIEELKDTVEKSLCNPDFITQADVPVGGLTINQPGVYKLGENIVYSGSGDAIMIAASGVLLDLQCFKLSTMSGANGIVVDVNRSEVGIKNGVIDGFSENGIQVAENCSEIEINEIKIKNCGTAIDLDGEMGSINTFEIESCKILDNENGITLYNAHKGFVRNCLLQTHIDVAIDLQQSFSNKIINCEICDVTSELDAVGISLEDGGGNLVKNCNISGVSSISTDSTDRAQGIFIGENEFQDKLEDNQICKIETLFQAQPFGIEMGYMLSNLNEFVSTATVGDIGAISWSPDARSLAVGFEFQVGMLTESEIRLFNAETLDVIANRGGISSGVNSISWSPDGRFMAADRVLEAGGLQNFEVILLDGGTLQIIGTTGGVGLGSEVRSVSWSPDGRFIAVGLQGGTVRLLDGGTLVQIATSANLGSAILSVSWSPDGRFIAAGPEGGTVRLLDGKTLAQIVASAAPGGGGDSVSWSSDGNYIAFGSGNIVRVLDGRTLDQIEMSADLGSTVNFVSCSPDGRFIAVGQENATVLLLDALIFPSNHLIKNNVISTVNGPQLPSDSIGVSSGRGISASSFGNTIISNQALNNDLNYTFAVAEQFLQVNMAASLGSAVPTRLSNLLYPPPAII